MGGVGRALRSSVRSPDPGSRREDGFNLLQGGLEVRAGCQHLPEHHARVGAVQTLPDRCLASSVRSSALT